MAMTHFGDISPPPKNLKIFISLLGVGGIQPMCDLKNSFFFLGQTNLAESAF